MLQFVNNLNGSTVNQRGTTEGTIYSNNTDFALVEFEESLNTQNGAMFLAWNDGDATIKGDFKVHASIELTYDNRDVIVPISGMASSVTRADNGGIILDLANNWKDEFFNGVTQTAESIYSWLCSKYGAHTYFYISTMQSMPGWFRYDPDLWAGNVTSAEVGLATGTAADIIFNPSIRAIDFTGQTYGVIASTYPDPLAEQYKENYILAKLLFDENVHPPVLNNLTFDVYIDGTKDPNVAIKWRADVEDNFSLQLVNPMVWCKPKDMNYGNTHIVDGYVVPNEAAPDMLKHANTWPGSYANPYITEFSACAEPFNTITRVIYFGFDGIADQMYYLLRMNQQAIGENTSETVWGDLFIVTVPRNVNSIEDINVQRVDGSSKEVDFATNVVVHLGTPDDDTPDDSDDYPEGEDYGGTDPGPYNPEEPKPDFTQYSRQGFTGKAVLTKTYVLDALKLANVGSKLWSQSYFDVLKIQNNPIENIVGVKWFPFSQTGAEQDIKVGNVNFEIRAGVVDTLYTINVGSVKYTAKNPASPTFLDMSPYTSLKLHLPFCGIVQLDATECLNRTIKVKYVVDLVAGDCIAFVYLDDGEVPYLNVAGNVGVDIPLTSSNRIQTEMRAASTAISAVTGAAGHFMAQDYIGTANDLAQGGLSIAGMDYSTQRTSTHSSACASKENGAVFLEIWRPDFEVSEGFKQRHGWPCHKFKTLGTLPGFVKCDGRTKLDFAATQRENEMIEQLLTTGVYITPLDNSWDPIEEG